ncbi:FecR family protein [Chitinophaga sp.]|uniref:FecR family protein n=1 Tax=Chitinophaga sp. TaxID=1869181 RepID=UPI002F959B58
MENERALFLYARKLAGEASPQELQELDQLLSKDTSLQYSISLLEHLESQPVLPDGEEEQLLQTRLAQLSLDDVATPRRNKVIPLLKWAAAAVVAGLVFTSAVYYLVDTHTPTAISARKIATRPGTRTNVVLEDGTRVWLNADSRIETMKGKREVTLTGEAYFDVVSDANHPFIVHVGGLDVRVLGTSLNIKAYPGQGAVETALIKGKVEVDLKEGEGRKILLLPGQKVTIAVATIKNEHQPVPPANYTVSNMTTDSTTGMLPETSWMDNQLVFKQQYLPDILKELERWYGVKIQLDNDRYNNEIITGTFKHKDLDQVLKALQFSAGFKYRTDSLGVHIY